MIINHQYRFIFLKTSKTAGTSVEIALSKFCDRGDVITPIYAPDEEIRRGLAYPGPRNYTVPFSRYEPGDWVNLLVWRRRLRMRNHMGAATVKRLVPTDVWSSYFKFAIERNPWDKVVSKYYWDHRGKPETSIEEWIRSGAGNRINGYEIYAIQGQLAVDRVLRYERLTEELAELSRTLRLPSIPELPRAKGAFRGDRRHYSEILSPAERQHIAVVYAREIALMGYQFESR